jgi:hypothetical protein
MKTNDEKNSKNFVRILHISTLSAKIHNKSHLIYEKSRKRSVERFLRFQMPIGRLKA